MSNITAAEVNKLRKATGAGMMDCNFLSNFIDYYFSIKNPSRFIIINSFVFLVAFTIWTWNIDFYVMYGQTEGTARLSYLNPNKIIEKLGSIGKAIPNGEFVLVDSKNQKIDKSNIEGELIYKGKNVMLG